MNEDRIYISQDLYLLKIKNVYIPYTSRGPIRGFNKNGVQVWRSYKTVDEAKKNLGL